MKSIFTKVIVILGIIVFVLFTIAAFIFGRASINCPNQQTTINSRIILEQITEKYFLVTKTYFMHEEILISIESGSDWENFLWGKQITGTGLVRVDYGVDLSNLNEENIRVNHLNKTVSIDIPTSTILDASIYGDIEYETEKGLFVSIEELFRNDKSGDYNTLTNGLIQQGIESIEFDPDIQLEAEEDAREFLRLIVSQFGYVLVD
jgi:hypothetical protein